MMVSWARVAAALTLAHGTAAQRSSQNQQHASVTTTQMSTSKRGYETYRVGVNFDSSVVQDVYALFGEAGDPMIIPPAFQVAAPFGADVGPVRPCLCSQLLDSSPSCRVFRLTYVPQYALEVCRSTRPSSLLVQTQSSTRSSPSAWTARQIHRVRSVRSGLTFKVGPNDRG